MILLITTITINSNHQEQISTEIKQANLGTNEYDLTPLPFPISPIRFKSSRKAAI